jgi:hypothetical protein
MRARHARVASIFVVAASTSRGLPMRAHWNTEKIT